MFLASFKKEIAKKCVETQVKEIALPPIKDNKKKICEQEELQMFLGKVL
jgi:hypothetical protein